jgi:hypothetical protein
MGLRGAEVILSKKRAKPYLIYIGFFFILIGVISLFFVGGLNEIILFPLFLLIGAICLIIGFTMKDFKK